MLTIDVSYNTIETENFRETLQTILKKSDIIEL